jgi:hypothetical protein
VSTKSDHDRLLVRQHERVQCSLRAEIGPSAESAEQVRLSRSVTSGEGVIDAIVTDCSGGGIGIRSPVFFPKGCTLSVRVFDGAESGPPAFVTTTRVQRVVMQGRTPHYDLGAAFLRRADGTNPDALLDLARRSPAPASAEVAPDSSLPRRATGA